MKVLESGCAESSKAAVHGTLGTLAAVCCLYNAAAWAQRREPHLLVNAVVYAGVTGFEIVKVRHHGASARATP